MREVDRAHVVEDALLYLNGADAPLTGYSGAVLLNTHAFIAESVRLRTRLGFPEHVSVEELDHLDGIAMCGGGPQGFELLRQSPLSRRKADLFRSLGVIQGYPRLCSMAFTTIQQSGKLAHRELPFAFHPSRGTWQCLNQSYRYAGKKTYRAKANGQWEMFEEGVQGEESCWPHIGCMASWLRRWAWHIELSPAGAHTSLALTTDATGIKGWFRLRDVPEGMDRRAALLHWVREHWREHRSDPETEVHVREHLRGRTTFDWFGLTGTICPSEPDQARAEASRRAKEAMDKLQRRRKQGR